MSRFVLDEDGITVIDDDGSIVIADDIDAEAPPSPEQPQSVPGTPQAPGVPSVDVGFLGRPRKSKRTSTDQIGSSPGKFLGKNR